MEKEELLVVLGQNNEAPDANFSFKIIENGKKWLYVIFENVPDSIKYLLNNFC